MSLSIVIAAAGQGKRLLSESLEIPKSLFYFRDKPIIAHMIDLYRKLSDNIIVIVSETDPGQFLKCWLSDYYKNPSWLTIVEQPAAIGTNDALSRVRSFVPDKCLISWSDFILDSDDFLAKMQEITEKSIFFTSNIICRFGEENKKIVRKQSNPGFIGIYYFDEFPNLDLTKEDFIENFINEKVNSKQIQLIDLGTVSELISNNAFIKKSNRFFNAIEFNETTVVKFAKTPLAISLQQKEVNWYKNAPRQLQKFLPKFQYFDKENKLVLEKIEGKILSEYKYDSDFWRIKLPELLNALHQPTDIAVDEESCLSVYLNKPTERFKEIEKTISSWFSKNKIINGIDFSNFTIPTMPDDLIPNKFTFCHGDLQFSNSMMDNFGNIKIFDPRGYFGNTLLYGDPAYDVAKILYAVDAYHKINEKKFSLNKLSNGETIFIHKSNDINDDIKWFFNWACDKYNISKEKLNYILFGIWLSLTSYIIDDPLAVVASYCKAMIRSREFLL